MKKYIYLFIILVSVVSCENEIPFNIKDNPPKLNINALFDADQPTNDIVLSLTGREGVTYINKASIHIYINGELKDHITKAHLQPNPFGLERYGYLTSVKLKPDDVVKIEALTDDGKYHAWSESIVPHPISIENIDTTMVTRHAWSDIDKFLRVKTTFTDNGRQTNYYRLLMTIDLEIEAKSIATAADTIIYMPLRYPLFVNEDVVLTDGHPSMDNEEDNILLKPVDNLWGVFDNSRLNGTYTMTTSLRIPYTNFKILAEGYVNDYTPPYYEQVKRIGIKVRIDLRSISKMQYFYLKALNMYDSGDYDEFFNQPLRIPSNIEGGTGIFGMSIGDQLILPLEDYIPPQ